jgi:hypothetical protein
VDELPATYLDVSGGIGATAIGHNGAVGLPTFESILSSLKMPDRAPMLAALATIY